MPVISLVPDPDAAQPDLCNVPLMLRRMADRIEAGEFGNVKDPDFVIRCTNVLSVSGMEPVVSGWGVGADANQVFVDLHAGAAQLLGTQRAER